MTAKTSEKARRAKTKLKTKKTNRKGTGKRNTKARRLAKPKRVTRDVRSIWGRSVGVALLLVAIVASYQLVQTQNRPETIQAQLNTLREDSVQARRRAVALEKTANQLKEELGQANAKRNQLQNSLQAATARIETLSHGFDAAQSLLETRHAAFETLQRKFEDAKQTAEQAEAQTAHLWSRIDEMQHRLKAMQIALGEHQQAALQANADAAKRKKQTVHLKSELEGHKQARESLQTELNQAKSQIKQLEDASPSLSKLAHATVTYPPYDPKTRDYLIRTIAFEASGESELGQAAVAHVVLNRMSNGRWGNRIEDVVTHPWQFEPWMTRRDEMKNLLPWDPRFRKAARIADAVLAGKIPDPTAGATHFLNPVVVRQRRGGSLPPWARSNGQPIGRHVFFSYNDQAAEQSVSAARPDESISVSSGPG